MPHRVRYNTTMLGNGFGGVTSEAVAHWELNTEFWRHGERTRQRSTRTGRILITHEAGSFLPQDHSSIISEWLTEQGIQHEVENGQIAITQ
jgi:hypothetical protein